MNRLRTFCEVLQNIWLVQFLSFSPSLSQITTNDDDDDLSIDEKFTPEEEKETRADNAEDQFPGGKTVSSSEL